MVNKDYKYNDEAAVTAAVMIENLYDTVLWTLDRVEVPEDTEYNEVHAEFMEQVVAIMYEMCKR